MYFLSWISFIERTWKEYFVHVGIKIRSAFFINSFLWAFEEEYKTFNGFLEL